MAPWEGKRDKDRMWRGRIRNDELWAFNKAEREGFRLLCNAWRDAAVADGWSIEQTYGHEPAEHAFRLQRAGYMILGLARPMPEDDRSLPMPDIAIWGPDGLHIPTPLTYDFAAIERGAKTCGYCGAHPVKTQRVAFANRACDTCGPIEQARLPHNWAA